MIVPRRLAVVLSHPTQYYSPWFRFIANENRCALRVFYLWDFGVTTRHDPRFGAAFRWDIDLLSGYDHEFVPNAATNPGTESFSGLHNPTLPVRLKTWKPDAILVFGYRFRTHLNLLRWARRHRIPLIFRGDSHLLGQPCPSLSKRLLLRWVYRHFAAFTYVGLANRDYFSFFGVSSEKLFFAPHAVNREHFDPRLPTYRFAASELRRRLEIPADAPVILFAGKFAANKQPLTLLAAFASLNHPTAVLLFVGDGELREPLRRAAAANGARVRFLPFANQSEMPVRYLLADVFALPSRGHYETWGLAVNEAMHMGVPCLVSDRVGCQRDLVTDGETGWVFPAHDPAALESSLARALAAVAGDTTQLRARIADRVSHYTYRQATEGLLSAMAHVVP
ncbi:glycosyltransferase family 4 protein [Horticoccus luteus]|uniref:Glycosyltransferase family 4 protein n=1 Tax=Horticoccus luteus TaxID=2862869 RepID=A0A8F9TZQ0_9BACT|nr:glycosyltransferase family 4 protein [Horticoccus luteus]QYM80477.1 glycosyltransferase family 4 protein [Horticoccus luteus]